LLFNYQATIKMVIKTPLATRNWG